MACEVREDDEAHGSTQQPEPASQRHAPLTKCAQTTQRDCTICKIVKSRRSTLFARAGEATADDFRVFVYLNGAPLAGRNSAINNEKAVVVTVEIPARERSTKITVSVAIAAAAAAPVSFRAYFTGGNQPFFAAVGHQNASPNTACWILTTGLRVSERIAREWVIVVLMASDCPVMAPVM